MNAIKNPCRLEPVQGLAKSRRAHCSHECYMYSGVIGKTPPRDSAGYFSSMTIAVSDPRIAGMQIYPRRAAVISWIFFDWAAQPYFTLITTFVFAPYFATHVAADPASGQSLWGFATAAAGLVIALMSPVLGAIADASGRRKPWVAGFGALLVIV